MRSREKQVTEDERKMMDGYQRRIAELEAELRMAVKTIQIQRDELVGEKVRIWAYTADRCYEDRGTFVSPL